MPYTWGMPYTWEIPRDRSQVLSLVAAQRPARETYLQGRSCSVRRRYFAYGRLELESPRHLLLGRAPPTCRQPANQRPAP